MPEKMHRYENGDSPVLILYHQRVQLRLQAPAHLKNISPM